PLEDLGGGLRPRRSDEDGGFAVTADQVGKPGLDATVEVADRVPLLGPAGDLRIVSRQRLNFPVGAKALGILQPHAFRTLEEHEMTERALPKGDQGELDIRRVPAREDREVWPLEM